MQTGNVIFSEKNIENIVKQYYLTEKELKVNSIYQESYEDYYGDNYSMKVYYNAKLRSEVIEIYDVLYLDDVKNLINWYLKDINMEIKGNLYIDYSTFNCLKAQVQEKVVKRLKI